MTRRSDPGAGKTGPDAVSVDDYKTAMRHVVSPVVVVTWLHDGKPEGLTITAICSATTEPPTLVVCLRGDKPAAERMRAAGRFGVNFLSDEQPDIARRFSSNPGHDGEAFDPGLWTITPGGVPLLDRAVSRFDCVIEQAFEQGSHVVFLGRVTDLAMAPGASLLYRDGFFRRLGTE
ncbi:flavin reductase family protein [Pararhodobacter marinus]|uniref:flavin reductase family protein n=1 Tax=Pararhodobacter marinus TaxID=2184063 RepID=UPI003511A1DE